MKKNIEKIINKSQEVVYENRVIKGINEEVIREISKTNLEPDWMLELRLRAYEEFKKRKMPSFGPSLEGLNLDEIYYFARPKGAGDNHSWEDVPSNLREVFDRLGIPDAEKEYLSGVGAQYDSEVVYHSIKKEYEDKGVVFMDLNVALRDKKYEEIIKKYFSKCIPIGMHKFSLLHYAVWSSGTFLYVPKGMSIPEPLQSYFRMNKKAGGQFEHTLIILEEGAEAHYIEGCSAPKYDKSSLHVGSVEIFVGKNAKMKYSSVENWSRDTYNLNTKRAIIEENGYIEWISGNMGSGVTMLYPCSILKGDNSKSNHLGVAIASENQIQDIGAKVIHIGKNTSSNIVSKSISKSGGISTYRGLVDIKKSALNSISKIDCNGLILDSSSTNNALPSIIVNNSCSTVAHEASAGKLNEKDLYYLMSRGIDKSEATSMIVNGFLSQVVDELPLEYASEMNVLISMEFE